MFMINRDSIISLVKEMQSLITNDGGIASNFHHLKSLVIEQELKNECEQLLSILQQSSDAKLIKSFRLLCAVREQQNQGSGLSFNHMPMGHCNQLYWRIAGEIFDPQNLGEMISILLPSLGRNLNLAFDINKSPVSLSRKQLKLTDIELIFQETSIDSLDDPLELLSLGDLVIEGDTVFDLKNITRLDFDLHLRHFEAIYKQHPELAKRLYQHNSSLKQLSSDCMTLSGEGCAPIEFIRSLILEFRSGGEKMTGNQFASVDVQVACTNFFSYLSSLPQELTEELFKLSAVNGKSLANIIDDLKQENCVETAADNLQSLIENNNDKGVLLSPPKVSPEWTHNKKKSYSRKKNILATQIDYKKILAKQSDYSHHLLPASLLQQVLPRISIKGADDYLSLLLSFPSSLYRNLLTHIDVSCRPILPADLADMISQGVFNDEQTTSLKNAINHNAHRFNQRGDALHFYVRLKDDRSFKNCLEAMDKNKRLEALLSEDEDGNTALIHYFVMSASTVIDIIKLLPEEKRLTAIMKENGMGETVLHYAATENTKTLRAILQCIPENRRVDAVRESDFYGSTVLHYACENAGNLKVVLEMLPENRRSICIMEEDSSGYSLMNNIKSEATLQVVLDSLDIDRELSVGGEWLTTNCNSLLSILGSEFAEDNFKNCFNCHANIKRLKDMKPKILLLLSLQSQLNTACDKSKEKAINSLMTIVRGSNNIEESLQLWKKSNEYAMGKGGNYNLRIFSGNGEKQLHTIYLEVASFLHHQSDVENLPNFGNN